jgi:hypothetical protein
MGQNAGGESQPTSACPFVVALLVHLRLLLPFPLGRARRHPGGRSRGSRQAGEPEQAQAEAAQDDAQSGIGAARQRTAQNPFRQLENEIARGAAQACGQRPAAEHRQTGEGARKQHGAAKPGEELADRPPRAFQPKQIPAEHDQGKDEADDRHAEELHADVGESRATLAEPVGSGAIADIAEARVVDVPGDQADDHEGRAGQGKQATGAQGGP